MRPRSNRSIGASKARAAGNAFETLLEMIHDAYKEAGRAHIEKVDPPTKVVGKGKVIYLANPFLDYVGSWKHRNGRMIVMEAKSTQKHRLQLGNEKGGLTANQIKAMGQWHYSGALTGLLWWHDNQIKVISFETINHALMTGAKSLRWGDYPPCRRGPTANIQWDWLAELE